MAGALWQEHSGRGGSRTHEHARGRGIHTFGLRVAIPAPVVFHVWHDKLVILVGVVRRCLAVCASHPARLLPLLELVLRVHARLASTKSTTGTRCCPFPAPGQGVLLRSFVEDNTFPVFRGYHRLPNRCAFHQTSVKRHLRCLVPFGVREEFCYLPTSSRDLTTCSQRLYYLRELSDPRTREVLAWDSPRRRRRW